MNEDEQTLNAFSAPNRRDAYTQARAATPEQKGLSYTDLLFDNIFGLDNEYESTGETIKKALVEDPYGTVKGMATSAYEGAVDLARNPYAVLGRTVEDTAGSLNRVATEDLDEKLKRMYGVSYEEATPEQVTKAREVVASDVMTVAGAIPGGATVKGVGTVAKGVARAIPEGVKTQAVNIAESLLTGGYDPVSRIFAGENARNFPRGKVARAQRLLNRGEDPQKIYEETGIEFLPQTERNFMRPVFSIDPEGMSVRDFDALQQVIPSASTDQLAKGESGIVKLPIKDVVDFSEFYDNYPQVEKFEVTFDPDRPKSTASFDAANKQLNLSMDDLGDTTPDKIRSIIIHELQHGVQAVEGTSGGAASEWFLDRSFEKSPRTGEWEKIGPWKTAAKDMSQDVDKLNKLEQVSKDAMKAYITGVKNNLSPEELDKLARKADSTLNVFIADRDRLEDWAFKKYQENQGEIESRAAQLWAKLTPEERLKTKPSDIYNKASDNPTAFYARLGEKPFYGDNDMPTARLPANNEGELRKRLNTDVQMLNMQDFKVDNPGGEWLEGKQKRASEYPDRKFMVGSTTGVIGGKSDFFLPTNILKDIPGLADEKRSKGEIQYDKLLSDAKENGFDPDQKGNKIVVAVNHFGQPYLLEGNTRVAVANTLNVPKVKVEVRYWNGAEGVDGPMNPEKVFGFASENPKSNGEKRQSFEIESQDASSIFGDGATYKLYKHPESGGYIQVLERKDGPASVISLEVPEDFRGQGIGQELQAEAMKNHPSLMGQVSSKAAATTAYRLGRRPYGNPNASLEDVFKLIDENSSVNMLTPDAQKSFGFASENSDTISTNQRYAEGGMVEEEQMNRLMEQGGMTDDGMSREPVTGNNIPPGALASEVRDDVDAKLSGGEYVVPADVLRYYGVRFFEDLRSQAKQGMMEMESAGRIGGVPVDPRGVPMQGQDEELTPEEEQMLAQAMSGMAEGGTVFNRGDFTMNSNAMTSQLYFNPTTGKKQTINFLGGQPLGGIPDGFVPWTQALQDTYDATKPATPEPKKKNNNGDDGFGNPEVTTNSYDAWADENYEAITNDPFKFGMDLLKNPNDDGGLFGVLTGKDKDILNIAGANAALKRLEAQGKVNSPEYAALSEEVKKYVGGLSLVERGLIATGVVGMGNQYDAAIERKEEKNPPAATPPAPPAPTEKTDGTVFGAGGVDSPKGDAKGDTLSDGNGGTSYNSPSTNRDRQSAADPRPSTNPTPAPTTTSSQGGSNTYSSSTYGSGSASYTPPKTQAERAGFESGGLVAKPKKPRAKTKGLAGKQ